MTKINSHLLALGLCLFGGTLISEAQNDYWIACGNQATSQYEVYDPTVTDWNSGSALKWTFAPSTSRGWSSAQVDAYSNPSDLKLRWVGSSQVVVSCASGGLATIATYPGGSMVWALDVGGSYNPHSVELLPNGNIAVAASAGNWVRVYASSQSSSDGVYAQFSLTGAHAVLWDPANNVLWALGTTELTALNVGGSAASPTLTEVTSRRHTLPASGGHEMSANWGDPDSMWISTSLNVYLFQKSTGVFYNAPGGTDRTAVKGCGNQPSGEIVQSQQDNSACTQDTWCTPNINFFNREGSLDYTRTKTGAAFYKCRVFSPDYQPSLVPLIGGDYDGDGVPDGVLFSPTIGLWSVRFSSNPGYIHTFLFGQSGDVPLIDGDFDGDHIPDSVIFRPSNGDWYVRFSSDASVHSFNLGQNGDIPLMGGDYDGDGQPDAVIFRPSNATWYVRFSSNPGYIHNFQFGATGDIPLLKGDWDGDGMPDSVLFRPSNGTWYVRYSKDASIHSFQFGQSGDKPVIGGDYDGDGQPDAVIFRPSNATWYVRFSHDGSVHSFGFGSNGDVPLVNGDWNGDGTPDSVIYQPFSRTWSVRFSSDASIHSFTF